jgi:cytochrome c551
LKLNAKSILNLTLVLVLCTFVFDCCVSSGDKNEIKFTQYFNKGEQLYFKHCSNCHQKDGSGLGLLYPPLKDADYMKNKAEVICLIKNGKSGVVIVNGKQYNQVMPAIPALTEIEIAQIATYIYNSWNFNEGLIEIKDVASSLNSCE